MRLFGVRAILIALVLVGCAPWSHGVLGPSQTYGIGLWNESGFQLVNHRRAGAMQTLTPELARSEFHVLGTWSLVDYRRADGEGVNGILVADLHPGRVLDDAIEHVMGEGDLFLAAHEEEARAALALPAAPPLDVTADGRMHPSQLQRRHTVEGAVRVDGEVRLTVVSSLVVTGWSTPCGGMPRPEVETVVDGVRWTRVYRVSEAGEVIGLVSSSEMERIPPPPMCDPTLA